MTAESVSYMEWIIAHPRMVALIVIWSLAWKGFALWKSAGLRHKWWFTAILLINTFGILEIIYLLIIARDYKVEVVEE